MTEVIWVVNQTKQPTPEVVKRKIVRCITLEHFWYCVVCVASVCSFACAVYVWITFSKMEELRRDMATLAHHPSVINKTYNPRQSSLFMKLLEGHTSYRAKQLQNKQLFDVSLFNSTQGAEDVLDVQIKQPTAIHFVPNGVTVNSIRNEFPNNQMCINKWSGVLCRNNTYRNTCSNQITEFWEKAPWTKSHTTNVFNIESHRPGVFSLHDEGLYLIYLNVLISATHSKHDVGIFILDNKRLICRENLDYFQGSTVISAYAKAKTCSITGVFYIEQNQTLSVKMITENTEIYMDSYNTNFGAVLLT